MDNNNSGQTDVKIQEQQTGSSSIDMGKLQELLRLVNGLQAGSDEAQAPALHQTGADPQTGNGRLTSQDTKMILNILEKKLSPEERSKLEMFRTLSRLFTMNQR